MLSVHPFIFLTSISFFFYSVCCADTVNGFSFHPFLPHAVSSSGNRRFVIPDDGNEDLRLSGIFDAQLFSVWDFFCRLLFFNFGSVLVRQILDKFNSSKLILFFFFFWVGV